MTRAARRPAGPRTEWYGGQSTYFATITLASKPRESGLDQSWILRTLAESFPSCFKTESIPDATRSYPAGALDLALDAVASQQGENDHRRRPLFDDATRREAAVYEQKSLRHSI